MSKRIIILCGIPTAGKSTWTSKFLSEVAGSESVSRDEIRDRVFGKDYWKHQKDKLNYAYSRTRNEQFVTTIFDRTVRTLAEQGKEYIILDNTHCKESYLQQAINKYQNEGFEVKVKFFEIPMIIAYYRNVLRYFKTGKWIPFKVINDMRKNYNKINKSKYYEKHLVL